LRETAASQDLPEDVRVDLIGPGQEADAVLLSLPAGPQFPGWRLALSLRDQQLFDAATSQRITSYIWIGVLIVGSC